MRVVGRVGGNLQAMLDVEADAISTRLRDAVELASQQLVDELRGQVRSAGLGAGLEKAWRRQVYPRTRKRTFAPAALVYSNADLLHDVFDTGPLIAAVRARFLTIPTKAGEAMGLGSVGSSRKGGAVPGERSRRYADLGPFADRLGAEIVSARNAGGGGAGRRRGRSKASAPRIVLRPARSGSGRLVALYYATPDARPVAVAVLVRAVQLRKVLDIDGAEQRAEAALSSALEGGE